MKNLKKLLIAVAILALLVTGVVISAFATSTEEAEFNRAKLFYSFVEGERTTRAKSEELKILYEFVATSSLNENVEGFAEFKANYQATSLKLAYSLYEEAMKVEDTLGRLNALRQVSVHFKACPVDDNTVGYAELNALVFTETDSLVRALYDEAVSADDAVDGGAKRREFLLKVFAQVASIPLLDTEWDYYYFMVDYNTSSVEAAMSLAEIAAGMFAQAEKEAREEYKSELITAIAKMYAEGARDLCVLEKASGALDAKDSAYSETYDAKIAEGADEQTATEAATKAGEEAYKKAIDDLKAAADKAYNDAIAEGATEEDAALAYDRAIYAEAYKAYDDTYAAGIANLEAEADAAYAAAYEAKLSRIYSDVYEAKLAEALAATLEGAEKELYDAKYAEALAAALATIDREAVYKAAYDAEYEAVYAAEMEKENAEEEAAKATADAAAKIAGDAAVAAAEAEKATEAANVAADEVAKAAGEAAKATEESIAAATKAAQAAKDARIEEIKAAAEGDAQTMLSAKKAPIVNAANKIYNSERENKIVEFNALLKDEYDAAYAEAYTNALLDIEGDAKAAYDKACEEAKNGGANDADAAAAGLAAYWEAVEKEANEAYDPVLKANYENALAVFVSRADEKYRKAYNDAYDAAIALDPLNIAGAVASAKEAGDAAYKTAINDFKAQLEAASDEAAYNKVINDALNAIADSFYDNIYATIYIEVEYNFTLPARNTYNDEYQNVYEEKYLEYCDKGISREDASTKASLDAKAAAEVAYQKAIKELVAAAVGADAYKAEYDKVFAAEMAKEGADEATAIATATAAAEAARDAAIAKLEADAEAARAAADKAATDAGKTKEEAAAAGEVAYLAFYAETLPAYYQAKAEALALARCEAIKAEIIERATKTAEEESAGAYDAVINKYKSAAEGAGADAGEKAYDAQFSKLVADYCEKYSVTADYVDAKLKETAKYNDPINDADLKENYSKAVKDFEAFYAECAIDEKFGSLAIAFERLDTVLKEVALTDARFILVEYDTIPNKATPDYPYPLNLKNAVICKVQNAINANKLDSSVAGFNDFYKAFTAAKSEYELLLEKAKNDLDRLADLDQYEWTSDKGYYEYKNDFSSGTLLSTQNQTATSKGVLGDENGDYNMIFQFGETSTHLYSDIGFTGKFENGLVLNYDIKFSEDFHSFQFRAISRSGATIFTDIFGMDASEGKPTLYYFNTEGKKVYVEDILDSNVWFHFTLTYNHSTHYGSLYVNYEYIGDVYYYDTANKQEVDLQYLRIGAITTNQAVSIDNLHFYAGSKFRDYYKFVDMSAGDAFKYYVDLFTDPSLNPANRNGAYIKSKELYQNFVNDASFNEYTKYFTDSQYENYYIDDIKNPAIATNMVKIAEMFEQIPEINSTSISSVRAAIASIEKFINNNTDFLDRTSEAYINQMAQLTVIEAEILRAEYVRDFIESLRFFDRATTLASMTKHYNNAKDIYILAGYGKTNSDGEFFNRDFIKDDPVIEEFAKYLNPEDSSESAQTDDPDNSDDPENTEKSNVQIVFDYFHETAIDKMAVREAYENSRRIVDCLYFILDMKIEIVDEEGNVTIQEYEDSEEFWEANYDYINTYVTIIRNVVSSGLYDETYTEDVVIDGEVVNKPISYFIEKYEHINSYFYELLQKEHVEVLRLQLEAFASVDSYIHKVGICNYIKNYIVDNDIDVDRPEFAEIIHKVEVYENELNPQKEDYALILNQNTQYFITAIKKMTAYVNYEDIAPLYDAATEYYYVMNVDSEEAKAAIELYEAYGEKLASIEEYSKLFIGYVREISFALKYNGERREKALYAALVKCMSCVDGIDMTYEGVDAAYATYVKELTAYNNGADIINSGISEIANVTCAVRTNSVSTVVLAVIKTIFSN